MSSRPAKTALLPSPAESFIKAGIYLRNWTPRTAVLTSRHACFEFTVIVYRTKPLPLVLGSRRRNRIITPHSANTLTSEIFCRTAPLLPSYASVVNESANVDLILKASFLSNADKEAILGGNLIKLLRLPA